MRKILNRNFIIKASSLVIIILFVFPLVFAQTRIIQKPKLAVLIVIDQFRYDYITRFSNQFTGGFKDFLDNGTFYTNANFSYAITVTSVGHTCISTGATPDKNGIIANDWYDRSLKRNVYSCEDMTAPLWRVLALSKKENRELSEKELAEGRSPRLLEVMTIGDALKMATNNIAKVYSVSDKDRSAIYLGGKMADGAYWRDKVTGEFTSSVYYGKESPSWLARFNKENPVSDYFGKEWTKLLPDSAYSISRLDDDSYENNPENLGITFPHKITGRNNKPDSSFIEAFMTTPYANEHLMKLAKTVIKEKHLGNNSVPDLLCISLSANDFGGHAYGPNSQEMQDFTLRTDRYLGDFFNYLDKTVGLEHTLIFLTADHGVLPLPEILKENGFDAGRLPSKTIVDTVNKKLKDTYGIDNAVEDFVSYMIYLNHQNIAEKGLSLPDIQFTATYALYSIPQVANAFTQHQLLTGNFKKDEISERYLRSCNPERSGDIFVNLKPFWYLGNPNSKGTSHGTPYPYDTHVPILALGYHIPHADFSRYVGVEDIAPTIANILGIELSTENQGQILYEVAN